MFVLLFEGTSASDVVKISKNRSLMYRAFFLGKDVFSSKRYRKEFFPIRMDVFKGSKVSLESIMIYLSCVGLYQIIYKLYINFRSWRKVFKV